MSFFSILRRFTGLPATQLLQNAMMKPNMHVVAIREKHNEKNRRKKRFTMPPYWLPRPSRVMYPEAITQSNTEFVNEMVKEKYESPLNLEVYERQEYKMGKVRCGVIATKLGSQVMWTANGRKTYVTLLHVSDNHVVKYYDNLPIKRKNRKDLLMGSMIVGSDSVNPQNVTSDYYKFFEDTGVMPKKKLTKFKISISAALPSGTPLYAGHFRATDYIDIAGTTVDRGFQGGMKRFGFRGMPAAHGVTKSHRRIGSIGSNRTKVWPGKKMPGHMGRNRLIKRGIQIVRVNHKYNVIYVHGSVVGEVGNYVVLYDSLLFNRRRNPKNNKPPFYPTYMPEYGDAELPEITCSPRWKLFDEPSIAYKVVQEKGKKKK